MPPYEVLEEKEWYRIMRDYIDSYSRRMRLAETITDRDLACSEMERCREAIRNLLRVKTKYEAFRDYALPIIDVETQELGILEFPTKEQKEAYLREWKYTRLMDFR